MIPNNILLPCLMVIKETSLAVEEVEVEKHSQISCGKLKQVSLYSQLPVKSQGTPQKRERKDCRSQRGCRTSEECRTLNGSAPDPLVYFRVVSLVILGRFQTVEMGMSLTPLPALRALPPIRLPTMLLQPRGRS